MFVHQFTTSTEEELIAINIDEKLL
jgi:hypothetical protein